MMSAYSGSGGSTSSGHPGIMEPIPNLVIPARPAGRGANPPAPNFYKIAKSVHKSIVAIKRKEIDTLVTSNRKKLKESQKNQSKKPAIPWENPGSAPPPPVETAPPVALPAEEPAVPSPMPSTDTELQVLPVLTIALAKVTTSTWTLGQEPSEKVLTMPIVTVPHVKRNPPYSVWLWTPRNYVVNEDERRHCPYFDEATFTEDTRLLYKLDTFVKEEEAIEVGDEDVFYNTVSKLHELEKEQRKNTTPTTDDSGWNQMIQETTVVRSSTSASLSPAASNFKPAAPEDLFTPSMFWFEALSRVMKCATAEKLREKFVPMLKKHHPIIRNLRTPGLNLDNDANHITYTADTTLESYRQTFCRKCFMYSCPFHIHDGVAAEYIAKNNFPELPPPTIPCSITCYLHDRTEDGKKHLRSKGHLDWDEKSRRLWGANDVSLCRVLLHVFKDNYCNVAKIMSTSCRIVQLFANTEKPKGVEVSSSQPTSNQRKAHKIRKPTRNVWTKGISSQELFLKTVYKPCFHPEMECTLSICTCLESQIPCEKYCTCPPNCVHRASGCKCEGRCNTRTCPCYAAQRECDPDLCCSCGANFYQLDFTTCRNIGIQRLWRKHLKMAESEIPEAGWGIFAMEPIAKGELVEEYVGELITDREADRRALEYQKRCHTFLFELNSEYSIDAQRKGSKARFANHADRANTFVKVMKVNTDQRLGIYALRDIQPNEELYLDYKKVIEEHKAVKQRQSASRRRRYPSKTVIARRISIDY